MKHKMTLGMLLLLCNISVMAQITGMWEVKNVTVESENLTPVAKWFQFNDDRSMQSGNGLTQNSAGTYILTPDNSVLIFTDQYGKTDKFGAFQVSLNGNKMNWNRVEEGQAVELQLERIDKKPAGPWDHVIGNWKLIESSVNHEIGNQQILMRWDREYRANGEIFGDNNSGIWHIHAKKPILRLVSFNQELPHQEFTVSFFENYRMIWSSDDGKTNMVFDRILE